MSELTAVYETKNTELKLNWFNMKAIVTKK